MKGGFRGSGYCDSNYIEQNTQQDYNHQYYKGNGYICLDY